MPEITSLLVQDNCRRKMGKSVSQPLISVLMTSYNHAKYIRQAIESIWLQSYTNIEIVVVDDASTDGSAGILESLCERSPVPMRIEINEYNRGPAYTLKKAFEISKGELVAFLASDDVYAPSRFEEQVRCFAENSQLLLAYADGQTLNADNTYGSRIHGEKVKTLLLRPPKEVLNYIYTHVSPLFIQCALVKRSLLLNSNAFESSALADDWLINIKMFEYLAQKGQCTYVDQVVCYYRIHGQNLHQNSDRQIALLKQTIESNTPAKLLHLARANIYWDIGLALLKTKQMEAIKYLLLSQANQFRPGLILDIAKRALLVAYRGLMKVFQR